MTRGLYFATQGLYFATQGRYFATHEQYFATQGWYCVFIISGMGGSTLKRKRAGVAGSKAGARMFFVDVPFFYKEL